MTGGKKNHSFEDIFKITTVIVVISPTTQECIMYNHKMKDSYLRDFRF